MTNSTTLAARGELAELVQAFDWSQTSLGALSSWPPYLRSIVELVLNSPIAMILLLGREGLMVYNDAYAVFAIGRHPGSLGRPVLEGWPEIADYNRNVMERGFAGESWSVSGQNLTVVRKGFPEEIWLDLSYMPVHDDTGQPAGILSIVIETTDSLLASRALVESKKALAANEVRLRAILESATDDAIVATDGTGIITEWNSGAEKIFGWTEAEMLGRTACDFFTPEDRASGRIELEMLTADTTGRASDERWHLKKDGSRFYAHGSMMPLRYGDVHGYLKILRDRTDEKVLQESYRLAQERNELALDAGAIIGTWIWDVPRNIVTGDERFARCFSLDPDECRTGLPIEMVTASIHPDDREPTSIAIDQALKLGGPFRAEYRVLQADGSYLWVEASGHCELDLDRRPVRFPGVLMDISERKRSLEALRRSEDRYRMAFEASGVLGAWNFDILTGMFFADSHFARIFGMDAALLESGVPVVDFLAAVHNDDRDRVSSRIKEALDSNGEFIEEYRIFGSDGRLHWVLARGKGYPETGQPVYATGVAVDITVRKHSEIALHELNATLEQRVAERTAERDRMWRLSTDLMLVTKLDATIVAVNPAWQVLLDWTQGELVGARVIDFIHGEDIANTMAEMDRLRQGERVTGLVNRYRHRDGSYRWISWMAVPEDGLFHAVGRDITADKEAETLLRNTEEQLRQAQKMEAVGQLTGGIAHDFNNLLAGITGSLELIKLRMAQSRFGEVERYVGAALNSANRAASLTHRLLAFSRRQTLDPKPVDLNRLVTSMEDLVRRTVGPGIRTEIVTAGGLWTTLCDANQLENALLNLTINARDAMPSGGKLTIETTNIRLDDAYAASQGGEVKEGQYVALNVSDTGTGMPPDVIARAFDPFFTTKPLGQGTGLGLSMIYGFVKQSGGHVRIYSEIGNGTTVKLYLPRHVGEVEADKGEGDLMHLDHAVTNRRVLVVDDEPVVRMLILDVLDELGYMALEAEDAASGLKILQNNPEVDMLVTDVGLPGGMNGRQLADAARELFPGVKILFITGYAENAAVGNGLMDVGMEVMSKPFAMDALAAKIGAMLG
jgi:PAS domain S-box-containing protein